MTAFKTARMARNDTSEGLGSPPSTPVNSSALVFAEKYLRFTTKYDKNGSFLQNEFSPDLFKVVGLASGPSPSSRMPLDGPPGRVKVTMLGAVVLALALVDLVFALDAVAAKVAQTSNIFINATSSIFAMASFRSLYFVIADMIRAFSLLKFGVALILAYVAVELILSTWIVIPSRISLLVIAFICVSSIVGSVFLSLIERPVKVALDEDVQLAQNFGLTIDKERDNPFT
jgi:hypothetical protein